MKNIFQVLLFLLFLVLVGWVALEGIERQERAECERWIQDSKQYPGYYFTDWQRQQCERYGFNLK